MAGARARWSGSTETLAWTLTPHTPLLVSIQYGSSATAPVNSKQLIKYKSLFRALHRRHKTLPFRKTQLNDALGIVAQANNFKLSATDMKEFQQLVCSRAALMCKHVAQAAARSKPPAWLREVLNKKTEEESAAADNDDGPRMRRQHRNKGMVQRRRRSKTCSTVGTRRCDGHGGAARRRRSATTTWARHWRYGSTATSMKLWS